jgi:hypothetical protein
VLNGRVASEELGFPQVTVLNSSLASNVELGTIIVVVFDVSNMLNVELMVAFRLLEVDVDDVRARLRANESGRHHGSTTKVVFLTGCGAFPSDALLSASEMFSTTDYIPKVSSCSSLSESDFDEALDSGDSLALLRCSRKVAGPRATSNSSKKSAYFTKCSSV